jgi:serine/threonine-protein kinase RsbW
METSKKRSRPSRRSAAVTVSCQATPDQLDVVHQSLARFWQELPVAPADEWRMLFEIAISEIAANIVEHAQPPILQLRLRARAGRVSAEFTDSGLGWVGPPDPGQMVDDLAERGRGLALAIRAVDDVVYERAGSTNRWRLVKQL